MSRLYRSATAVNTKDMPKHKKKQKQENDFPKTITAPTKRNIQQLPTGNGESSNQEDIEVIEENNITEISNKKMQINEKSANMKQHLIQQINEEIKKVSRLSQIEIGTRISNSDTIEEKRKKIEELKGYQKAIYRARKLENNMVHKQRIENNI
ncbi:38575_t:CDS:2 [Gigaspora margarita]|uniref:38575_t:CDS:1 n=1 Tax=Gigaspora margarita TaxID=4874 RepID=A0ABM8W364_GIGMA|nr:38575_t:CDS:2 [Gigaspora margarita]